LRAEPRSRLLRYCGRKFDVRLADQREWISACACTPRSSARCVGIAADPHRADCPDLRAADCGAPIAAARGCDVVLAPARTRLWLIAAGRVA